MKTIVLLFIGLLFISCTGDLYVRNGAGHLEKVDFYERYEKPKGEYTIQTFSIGDSTYTFNPGSYKAISWIAERREKLRESAIKQGYNPDWYIDRNIDEGERR